MRGIEDVAEIFKCALLWGAFEWIATEIAKQTRGDKTAEKHC